MGNEPVIVLDTQVLVWWLASAPGLTPRARRAIGNAVAQGAVAASAISVLEIATAVRRGRLQFSMPVEQWLADARSLPKLRFEPVSPEIALLAGGFGDDMHGDPADRMIAATAIVLGATLVTADEKLRANRVVKTLW